MSDKKYEFNRLISDEVIERSAINHTDAESFRLEGKKFTAYDPDYKDSVTFYRKPDGAVMIDSFEFK